jgi:hypothetical protein
MGARGRTAFLGLITLVSVMMSSGIAAADETNPMRLAVSSCMSNALQTNSMVIMVDVDTNKPFVTWECSGSIAQDLFEKLETVATQEVNSDGTQISREVGGGFVCVSYTGTSSNLGYRCYLSIPVTEPFSKLLNQ